MASKFFLSLTAFSLSFSFLAFAEEGSAQEEIVETSEEPVQKSRRVAFPSTKTASSKEEAVKAEQPKKTKPHFAGVRRTVETETKSTPPKKSRKIKNEWFSSKTQPKAEKKHAVRAEEEAPAELPADRPYFVKASYTAAPSLIASNQNTPPMQQHSAEMTEGELYPRTGFLAPNGHIYFTGEWLYWRTRQEGMEFATAKQVKFDYQSGFRIGAGAHLPSFDGWSIYVNYTRFTPDASGSAHSSPYPLFLFQGSGVSGNAVDNAFGHWKIQFQNADLQFGKAYYLTKTLVFSPFFGLKGAWIDQHAHFRYDGGYIPVGETFHTHFKNDFKGAGPLIGTQIDWQLGAGFSFFGDAATSLVIGQFVNTQKQYQLGGMEVVHLSDDFHLVSPYLGLAAGLAWDYNFHRDICHFGLSLGFEAQQWWSQNQTEQFTDDVRPTYFRQRGDLSFYGLTLKARLDF